MEWNEREILRYLGHRGQEIPENVIDQGVRAGVGADGISTGNVEGISALDSRSRPGHGIFADKEQESGAKSQGL